MLCSFWKHENLFVAGPFYNSLQTKIEVEWKKWVHKKIDK